LSDAIDISSLFATLNIKTYGIFGIFGIFFGIFGIFGIKKVYFWSPFSYNMQKRR
jgi:hypothetical protein